MTKTAAVIPAVHVAKRHQNKKASARPFLRKSAISRCMMAAGCTLLPSASKAYLGQVVLRHLDNVMRDVIILANEQRPGKNGKAVVLGLRHLKLALALRGFTMFGGFVRRSHKASKPALVATPKSSL